MFTFLPSTVTTRQLRYREFRAPKSQKDPPIFGVIIQKYQLNHLKYGFLWQIEANSTAEDIIQTCLEFHMFLRFQSRFFLWRFNVFFLRSIFDSNSSFAFWYSFTFIWIHYQFFSPSNLKSSPKPSSVQCVCFCFGFASTCWWCNVFLNQPIRRRFSKANQKRHKVRHVSTKSAIRCSSNFSLRKRIKK